MRKRNILISTIFIFIALYLIYLLFFDVDITGSKYTDIRSIFKKNNGGIVYNDTEKDIQIVDNTYKVTLPAHKNSRDIGVFDADAIIFGPNVQFEEKMYSNKVFKFCDFGRIKITTENNKTIVKPFDSSWVCKGMDDYNIYNSIPEAYSAK